MSNFSYKLPTIFILITFLVACKSIGLREDEASKKSNTECKNEQKECNTNAAKRNKNIAPAVEELRPAKVMNGDMSKTKKLPPDEGVDFNKIEPITIKFPNN